MPFPQKEEASVGGEGPTSLPWLPSATNVELLETKDLGPVPLEDAVRQAVGRLAAALTPRLPDVGRDFLHRGAGRLSSAEVRLWGRIGEAYIGRFFGLLERGDVDQQGEEMKRLARELAREGLPFASFISAFQLYEECLLPVLVEIYPRPEELKAALEALEKLQHNNFSIAAVAYLSQYNQKILQLNRNLDDSVSLINAMGFAMEEASAKLGLQNLVIPLILASQVKYMREEMGVDLEVDSPAPTALDVCRSYVRYLRALGLNTDEQYVFEELQNGVRITVDHHCFHAPRCQAQQRKGVPLACMRASGMEMALNWKLEKPFVATDKELKPGEACTFCLRSVL